MPVDKIAISLVIGLGCAIRLTVALALVTAAKGMVFLSGHAPYL
jgi:hypothetical protein